MQDSAAGPVHDVCQQDDDQDHDHQPGEEHDDPGDDVPSYSSRSSHGLQLPGAARIRSEEHTSELQSHVNLVCRLLLEKKKKKNRYQSPHATPRTPRQLTMTARCSPDP